MFVSFVQRKIKETNVISLKIINELHQSPNTSENSKEIRKLTSVKALARTKVAAYSPVAIDVAAVKIKHHENKLS